MVEQWLEQAGVFRLPRDRTPGRTQYFPRRAHNPKALGKIHRTIGDPVVVQVYDLARTVRGEAGVETRGGS